MPYNMLWETMLAIEESVPSVLDIANDHGIKISKERVDARRDRLNSRGLDLSTPSKESERGERCEYCNDSGYYGDNGPGLLGNTEAHECDQCAVVPDPRMDFRGVLEEWVHQDDLATSKGRHDRNEAGVWIRLVHKDDHDHKIDRLERELAECREALAELRHALLYLKRGECWCEASIDNPMMGGRHTKACDLATTALAKLEDS